MLRPPLSKGVVLYYGGKPLLKIEHVDKRFFVTIELAALRCKNGLFS